MCRAADIAKESNRNTVSAADILGALRDLEFDDFVPSVESALAGPTAMASDAPFPMTKPPS